MNNKYDIWRRDLIKYFSANKDNVYSDAVNADDYVLVFRKTAAAGNYDRLSTIDELIAASSGGASNLGYTLDPTIGTITNSNGTGAVLPVATPTTAGLLSAIRLNEIIANNAFRVTPSTIITAGTNLSWSGNTLNATGGSGSGNVVGPSLAVDENIAIYNGVTGKIIKDGGATIAAIQNVSTNLSEGTSTMTTIDVNSSDGTNATLVAASTSRAGVMTKSSFDSLALNITHRTSDGSDHSFIDQSVISGGTPTFTNTNFSDSIDKRYVTDAKLADLANTTNTNSGDQTSIVGIGGTKVQFNTELSDGTFMYIGDAPTSHALLSHTIAGETLGHVLAADSATTYSIRQLLGSEINNDLNWAADQDLSGYALVGQTFYIGTTQVAINRASATLTLAGLTLTTPDIGTPSAGTLTNATGLPVTSGLVAGDWKTFYSNGSGELIEVALGAATKVWTSNGTSAAPTWEDAAGGGIGGSIADNQVAVGNGTDAIDGSSAFTFNGTTLGLVGNSLITGLLEVNSTIASQANIKVKNLASNGYAGFNLYNTSGTIKATFNYGNSGVSIDIFKNNVWIGNRGTTTGEDIIFTTNGIVQRMLIQNNGYVKFGTGTASEVLDVVGNGLFSGTLKVGAELTQVERSSDPADPAEGSFVTWLSDGTATGDDGDVLIKKTYGSSTYTINTSDYWIAGETFYPRTGTAAADTLPIQFTDGVLASTPVKGALEFANSRFYITNVAHQRAVDRTSDVVVSTVTVANTTGETTIFTATMNANSLMAGNGFILHADGIVENTGSTTSDEVTIRIKVGGVTTVTLSPDTKTLTAGTMWHINANATQRTIGATGSRASHIHMTIGDPINDGDEVNFITVGTIDTTANMDITITVQWASADVGNTLNLYQGFVKYIN